MHGLRLLPICALTLALVLLGCSSAERPAKTVEPSFEFVFAYGVGAKNVLDTGAGTFTKDMVMARSVTTTLTLTPEEKERVWRTMNEIGLLGYPARFELEGDGFKTPYETYRFEVRSGGATKTVEWRDDVIGHQKDERAEGLRTLIDLVRGMVETKPEYRKLPPASGGYL